MKQYGWARAPLILGFVLGKLIEKYLFISVGRYQFDWLERPGVIAIFAVTALVLARPVARARSVPAPMRSTPCRGGGRGRGRVHRRFCRGGLKPAATGSQRCAEHPGAVSRGRVGSRSPASRPGLWVHGVLGFACGVLERQRLAFSARLMPQTAAAAGMIVIGIAALMLVVAPLQGRTWLAGGTAGVGDKAGEALRDAGPMVHLSTPVVYARLGVQMLWLIGFLAAVWLIGLMPTMGLYMFLYMATAGRTRWPTALAITVSVWVVFYFLFVKLLHVPWPPSLLGDTFPDLREWTGRLI